MLSPNFYVNDFLGGAASKQDALKLSYDLIIVLKKAGLKVYKWLSNENKLLISVKISLYSNNGRDLS